MRVLKLGDRGKEVLDIQSRLTGLGYDVGTDGVDGLFGPDTLTAVLNFQQASGLLADGVIAENTWRELVEARYEPGERLLYMRIPPFRGADVLFLQRSLNRLGFNAGPEDGILGPLTERAVLDFQRNAGLVLDGMVDESVLRVMAKVTKDGEPHFEEAKIPDRHGGYTGGKSLAQMLIAIDPGHGGEDAGVATSSGVFEKDLNLAVSLELARELQAAGARVVLTREDDSTVTLYRRAEIANLAGADIFISIHQNYEASPRAQGPAAYFFCRQGYFSEAGSNLAGHIVSCIADKFGVPAIPPIGRNYAVLRETEMTAVMVEPMFISSAEAESPATVSEASQLTAEAIFAGLTEYFAT